jgi:hypothetical protein
MREAAARVLDFTTVGNPSHCRRKTQLVEMSAMAEDEPTDRVIALAAVRPKPSLAGPHSRDRSTTRTGHCVLGIGEGLETNINYPR